MSPTEIFFIDIETIAYQKHFDRLDERTQKVFLKKFNHTRKVKDGVSQTDQELWVSNAALYAEYNTIIVICVGIIKEIQKGGPLSLHIKTFVGDEKIILLHLFSVFAKKPTYYICGHNSVNFDFPVMGRKYLLHKIKLPDVLNVVDLKPWENKWMDTMRMWSFGEFKASTSLDSLACAFNLPSPKTILGDRSVHEIYYEPFDKKEFDKAVGLLGNHETEYPTLQAEPEEIVRNQFMDQRLATLGKYCAGDTVTTAQLYLLLKGLTPIQSEFIYFT